MYADAAAAAGTAKLKPSAVSRAGAGSMTVEKICCMAGRDTAAAVTAADSRTEKISFVFEKYGTENSVPCSDLHSNT